MAYVPLPGSKTEKAINCIQQGGGFASDRDISEAADIYIKNIPATLKSAADNGLVQREVKMVGGEEVRGYSIRRPVKLSPAAGVRPESTRQADIKAATPLEFPKAAELAKGEAVPRPEGTGIRVNTPLAGVAGCATSSSPSTANHLPDGSIGSAIEVLRLRLDALGDEIEELDAALTDKQAAQAKVKQAISALEALG